MQATAAAEEEEENKTEQSCSNCEKRSETLKQREDGKGAQ